jgi:hypothetical protein
MTYELWDTSVGTMILLGSDKQEMAGLIRSLILQHGHRQVSDLSMSVDDPDGNQLQLLTGNKLSAWVDEVLNRSDGTRDRVAS